MVSCNLSAITAIVFWTNLIITLCSPKTWSNLEIKPINNFLKNIPYTFSYARHKCPHSLPPLLRWICHDHLFFQCHFSRQVWGTLAARIRQHPPLELGSAIDWVLQTRTPSQNPTSTIIKLLLQASVSYIWKGRSSHLFTQVSFSPASIRISIDRHLRVRLLALPPSSPPSMSSLFDLYFGYISSPL